MEVGNAGLVGNIDRPTYHAPFLFLFLSSLRATAVKSGTAGLTPELVFRVAGDIPRPEECPHRHFDCSTCSAQLGGPLFSFRNGNAVCASSGDMNIS